MPLPSPPMCVTLTVDHVTFTMQKLSDEESPLKRLWRIAKQFPQDEPGYLVALNESLIEYNSEKGCVYRGRGTRMSP
jgi:hypothetical protein